MVTPPRQERSTARRLALLRAAVELLAEGGARAVTHRAVAQRAGVPLATTTYFFASIQQLTEEALALHVSERVHEFDQLVKDSANGQGSPLEVAGRVAAALSARAVPILIAQFEIYIDAARNPALRGPVAASLDAFERLAAEVLAALGVHHPERSAPAFIALFDGFALHRLARPRPPEEEHASLTAAIRALFIAELMDPADLESWDRRMRERPPLG